MMGLGKKNLAGGLSLVKRIMDCRVFRREDGALRLSPGKDKKRKMRAHAQFYAVERRCTLARRFPPAIF